jgi:hypothetical protein
MFATELTLEGHCRRFVIAPAPRDGWELREEFDDRLVRRVHLSDWHRVERAVAILLQDVAELERVGWQAVSRGRPVVS